MEPATVLIADDDDALLGLMLRRIQRMNLRADSAQDGSRAAAMLEQGEYHLLITDINMPGRSGLELLEQAKSRDPNLQVVIVTGGATLETAIQAVNNGAFAYLTKPFDHISVLENTAFRALEYRRLRIENQRMAEIQRRRGDMLEQEVADRLLQVSRQDREMREIMAQLPEGILILGGNRGLVPGNDFGKRWLELDLASAEGPITAYLELGARAGGVRAQPGVPRRPDLAVDDHSVVQSPWGGGKPRGGDPRSDRGRQGDHLRDGDATGRHGAGPGPPAGHGAQRGGT